MHHGILDGSPASHWITAEWHRSTHINAKGQLRVTTVHLTCMLWSVRVFTQQHRVITQTQYSRDQKSNSSCCKKKTKSNESVRHQSQSQKVKQKLVYFSEFHTGKRKCQVNPSTLKYCAVHVGVALLIIMNYLLIMLIVNQCISTNDS